MTSQTARQIITIHTLANISGSKDIQTMKYDQLIEYNMKNIFLEKSYTKYCGEATIIDKIFQRNSSFDVK